MISLHSVMEGLRSGETSVLDKGHTAEYPRRRHSTLKAIEMVISKIRI
jgi:hypothetical protein